MRLLVSKTNGSNAAYVRFHHFRPLIITFLSKANFSSKYSVNHFFHIFSEVIFISSDFVGKMKCLERVSCSSGITMFTFLFSFRNQLTPNISENHVFMRKPKPIRKISSPISKLYKNEAILKFMMHSIQTFFSDYAVLWIITIDRELLLQFDVSFIRIHGCYSWS